jgi:hypothetical protein
VRVHENSRRWIPAAHVAFREIVLVNVLKCLSGVDLLESLPKSFPHDRRIWAIPGTEESDSHT